MERSTKIQNLEFKHSEFFPKRSIILYQIIRILREQTDGGVLASTGRVTSQVACRELPMDLVIISIMEINVIDNNYSYRLAA